MQVRIVLGGLLMCLPSICSAASASAEPGSVRDPETSAPPARSPPTQLRSSSPPSSPTRGVREHWYGWQILLTATGSIALGVVPLVVLSEPTPLILGGSGLVLGGPIVHWAHGNVGKGFGSLGLNVGLPLVLGVGGALACGSEGCGASSSAGTGALNGFIIGAGIGMIAALTVDVAVLAYEPVASEHTASRAAKPAFSLVPDIVVTRDRAALVGLRGVF